MLLAIMDAEQKRHLVHVKLVAADDTGEREVKYYFAFKSFMRYCGTNENTRPIMLPGMLKTT